MKNRKPVSRERPTPNEKETEMAKFIVEVYAAPGKSRGGELKGRHEVEADSAAAAEQHVFDTVRVKTYTLGVKEPTGTTAKYAGNEMRTDAIDRK